MTSVTPSPLEQPGGAGLTVDELATASGIATTDIEALVAAGVLPTGEDFRASDITKARLVMALVEAGFALDELSGAITQGRLSFDYVEHLMPEPVQYIARPDRSDNRRYREELRPILGGSDRGDGTVRADEVAVAELVARGVELGAPMERIVRIVRSMAQTAEHLVDLQRDFIDDVLLGPAIASTGSPIAALAETAPSRFEFRELGRRLWWLLLERSADEAIFKNIVQLTERALREGGVSSPNDGQSVVFVDVSGYTRRSQEAGDAAAAQQALLLADFVHGLAVPVGGRLVRSLGDGALAYFPDATRAVRFALDAVALAPANGIWNLHAGVNTGPMVRRDGDYYGTAVNIASRVADQASQDHVVVTRSVLDAWAGADAVSFTPIGSVSLKNVAEPVELYEAVAVAP